MGYSPQGCKETQLKRLSTHTRPTLFTYIMPLRKGQRGSRLQPPSCPPARGRLWV